MIEMAGYDGYIRKWTDWMSTITVQQDWAFNKIKEKEVYTNENNEFTYEYLYENNSIKSITNLTN